MSGHRYTYQVSFADGVGVWEIIDMGSRGYCSHNDPVVWSMPWLPEHDELGEPPLEFRQKYEALLRASGWVPVMEEPQVNVVEMIADEDDCAWDQPCAHGHRVEHHAVYCHNKAWLYAPSKCRRHRGPSVWSDKPWPHEECPGFMPNPLYRSP